MQTDIRPVVAARAVERRALPADQLEVRADGDTLRFLGHAAVFDRLSENLGGFREKIQRGAFRKALDKNPDVRLLLNHNADIVLARSTISQGPGLLDVSEDPKGLRTYAELAPTSWAKDIDVLIRSGVISQMSFGFRVAADGQVWEEIDGELIRTIIAVDELLDCSIVTFPAYPQTDASMRSVVCGVEIVNQDGELEEQALRELGWKIHRGELTATDEERGVLDAAFARMDTVSPWIAERALRATCLEPELRAAIQGKTATVVLEDETPMGEQLNHTLAAWQWRLRALDPTSKETP